MPRTRVLSIVMVVLAGITAMLMLTMVWLAGNRVVAGALSVVAVGLFALLVLRTRRRVPPGQ